MLRLLRLFERSDGMPGREAIAMQKRELEEKLLAAGCSRRLAKIAVRQAFRPTAQPD